MTAAPDIAPAVVELEPVRGVRVLLGDCRATLASLPDASVHCVVTSPPYYGLRDYGTAGQIGLEADIEAYLETMVAVFREVRRILRPDGTLWLNLGDGYNAGTNASRKPSRNAGGNGYGKHGYWTNPHIHERVDCPGLKPKDLLGIPWRVAFALQADGWYLRADNIWAKPNPMPESVTDRPTKAHEYVFLLAKSERYFYDRDAVLEPVTGNAHGRGRGVHPKSAPARSGVRANTSFGEAVRGLVAARNRRTVWTLPTQAYRGAHFATFPAALADLCVRAGTSTRGCCAACGAPWERNVERVAPESTPRGRRLAEGHVRRNVVSGGTSATTLGAGTGGSEPVRRQTLGWRAACACAAAAPVPCTVLDPFAGSGTSGAVARALGRDAVLCEINPDYVPLIEARVRAAARRPADTSLFHKEGL